MRLKQITVFIALLGMMACTYEKNLYEEGNLVPFTVEHDASLPSITVNGINLHAEAVGHPDSTLIICLHGGPGNDYRYMLHCAELASHGYRVVFYDQTGSGLSARRNEDFYESKGVNVLNYFYEEVLGVIRHYKTHSSQKVVLLGHSWGGMLATGVAGQYPDSIQGLIVCEPGGLKWNDIETYVGKSRSMPLWSEFANDYVYLDQFLSVKDEPFLLGTDNVHAFIDYKMGISSVDNSNTDPSDRELFWRMGGVVSSMLFKAGSTYQLDLSQGINQFSKPVLFFYSSNNSAYTDTWAQKISSAYNTVQLRKVNGVGHGGILTNPNAWSSYTQPEIITYLESL